jgi:hypothetical protein
VKIANSELRSFKRCRRQWYLTYVRRLRKRHEGPGPLAIGNMVHGVLEWYYTIRAAQGPEAAAEYAAGPWRETLAVLLNARIQELEASGADSRVPDMLKDAELARIMLEGYFDWLSEDGVDAHLDLVGAEQELEAYIGSIEGEDVWLVAKLDLIAVLRDTGEALFLDHKTAQNIGDHSKTAHLDEQQLTYGLVQRLLISAGLLTAPRAVGGILNVLRKVKRTASAKPPFYGRVTVRHAEEEYASFYRRVWYEVRDLIRARRELEASPHDAAAIAYPNPTRDCSWQCPFFGVCPMFDDGSDVEFVLADAFDEHDPYERYVELEKQ